MNDCEGKDVQVGDEVVIWYSQYRVGKLLGRGKVHKIMAKKMNIKFYRVDSHILWDGNYFPREVFKL